MIVGAPLVRPVLALTALVGIVAAGCGGEIMIRQSDVETQAKRALGHLIGRAPESVTCPGDMRAEVGHTMRCILDDHGSRVGVTITVTSIDADGRNAKFDIKLDTTPMSS